MTKTPVIPNLSNTFPTSSKPDIHNRLEGTLQLSKVLF